MKYESKINSENSHVIDRSFVIADHKFMIRVYTQNRHNADNYKYYLPNGTTYTHPTEAGCYIACMQWLEENDELTKKGL